MEETPEQAIMDSRSLKLLRTLVTVLMVVMICGFIVLIAFLVTRFPERNGPVLPEAVVLPDGTRAEAVTLGRGWAAIVTDDDRILIFDPATGALRQEVAIETGAE
ncbi:MAG: hypothetical protein CMH12_06590 [Maritimibacter sp.]|nr:hypothetical protein [Maritimibacter sp.]